MLTVISPAKTLDFEQPAGTSLHSQPVFAEDSAKLINKLRRMSRKKIGQLMDLSAPLASLNHERYQTWSLPFTTENAKQALLAFRGEVYRGLDADSLSEADLAYAQDHLRILSGLHGVLRPMDLMQPHRLEMGTSLPVGRQKNLYQFWGSRITEQLNAALESQEQKVLVNLASNEYFKAVHPDRVNGRLLNFQFRDLKNGEYKMLMSYAKIGRGLMAGFILRNRIEHPEDLKAFDALGYGFNARLSDADTWVFTRDKSVKL